MKKLLTLAVAAAIAAPMAVSADTTIYGRINNALVHADEKELDANGDIVKSGSWDVEDNSSRFGVKGSEDLGNGLTAIFQYEWKVDSEDSAGLDAGRLAYVGLTGGFGTVAIGHQWTPYYGSVDKTDIFQINSINDEYIGPFRVGNTLAYVSPNFGGFSAKIALIISDEKAEGSDADLDLGADFNDGTNISLDYNNGPLSVGASYLQFDSNDNNFDGAMWGVGAKYSFGNFAIIGQYESASREAGMVMRTIKSAVADISDDIDAFGLAAEAYFGSNTLRVKYGAIDYGKYLGEDLDAETWALGLQHAFSKRTSVFAEYENSEVGDDNSSDRFGVGLRHDF
ncbi:porin [Candidatus Vondammii sp. HM_W22]|uniref:porin n=1 Tax=Candidatus Vondammii sp. HM_W22 TaxID=2687299 RepID=UPI001F144DDD|nr:porin [Candidatus Vondammii sp. HM_W22]